MDADSALLQRSLALKAGAGGESAFNRVRYDLELSRYSLHSVWDSGILTKNIRELSNYTRPTRRQVFLIDPAE